MTQPCASGSTAGTSSRTNPQPAHTAGPGSQATVLVVDDQAANIIVLHQALAPEYRVLMATTGEQALQLCRQDPPDLVLLDVVMPDLDGHEVCRQLKAAAETRDVPVIFVTAQGDAEQEALGLQLGAVDFITKPITPAVVRARVATQLRLARATSLLGATLECTADGILVTTQDGAIGSLNEAFVQMWNVPARLREQGRAEALFEHMRAQCVDAADTSLSAAAATGVSTLRGDRHIEHLAMPLRIHGQHGGHVISFRDVTERTRALRQLKQLNENLDARVQARTQELRSALHRADAASQAKSDFLVNMSHEIRTPLNGVIGMTYRALQAKPEPAQRHFLQSIRQAGQHLLGVVSDILDFAKIEAGMLELDATDFKVGDIFERVSDQMLDSATAKGLRLCFEVDGALAMPLRGDALRLQQVLMNYVSNAIKFTRAGHVHVHAGLQPDAEAGDDEVTLRFEVRDTGIGMSAMQLEQLFQAFHQADASISRQYGGSGLGLAICRQLATLLGGDVGARSEPGQGSTFWFTARCRRANATAGEATRASQDPFVAPEAQVLARLRGSRILLAEDNALNREVACGLLMDVGCEVVAAGNGREALELLAQSSFDCVLMDVQMPVLDGLEATRRMRADARLAHTPVVAMTANVEPSQRRRCMEAGMVDFVVKPVVPAQLYATLARCLSSQPAPGEPATGTSAAPPPVAVAQNPAQALPLDAPQALDLSVLPSLVGNDAERLERYRRLYVQALRAELASLNAALQGADLRTLSMIGHRLKSSSRAVGAMRIGSLCQALEDLNDPVELAHARALVHEISLELERVNTVFEALAMRTSAAPNPSCEAGLAHAH